jgi:OOP family OmpA-OmpF porin
MVLIGFVALIGLSAMRSAAANPLVPDGMTFPDGYTVVDANSKVYDYFHVEVGYHKGGVSVLEDYAGKTWSVYVKVTPPNKVPSDTLKQIRSSLKAQGWEHLTEGGLVIARRTFKGKQQWMSTTTSGGDVRMMIVEVGPPPHTLTLSPPAKVVEKIGPKDDFPYLAKLPGSTLDKTQELPQAFDVTPAGASSKELAGPPLTLKQYTLPKESSAYERMVIYRDALSKAGWTIIRATAGGDSLVVAHYAKDGRDVFVYLHDGSFQVADVGAQNDAKRLLDIIGKDGHVAIYGIYFDIDKDVLKPESEIALGHILDLMKLDPKLALEVQGHTDNTGTPDHNKTLSDARAASVKKWLVAHGVADKRLTPKGYGDTVPVGDNKTPDGRAKNRRVELKKL